MQSSQKLIKEKNTHCKPQNMFIVITDYEIWYMWFNHLS